jgi:hypothetical protein
MTDEKKPGFFKKIFGRKSSCCSFDIEEIDSNEGESSDSKDTAPSCCCCSAPTPDEEKNEDVKEQGQRQKE